VSWSDTECTGSHTRRRGTLDVVCTRSDLPLPAADIIDVYLSDHRLLRWHVPLVRPPPVYTTITTRPWRQLYIADLRAGLLESSLCRSDTWDDLDLDNLAQLYDDVIINVLDRFIPFRTVKCRRRPSDPWFDTECRAVQRLTRRLERIARRPDMSNAPAAAAATAEWRTQRRVYRDLRNQKRESFWRKKVESERSFPQQLWKLIDALLGRGHVPPSHDIGAETFHQFFEAKVAGVRASTTDAPSPSFTSVPPELQLFNFRSLTVDDVTHVIHQLPDKQCASDSLPTLLLK